MFVFADCQGDGREREGEGGLDEGIGIERLFVTGQCKLLLFSAGGVDSEFDSLHARPQRGPYEEEGSRHVHTRGSCSLRDSEISFHRKRLDSTIMNFTERFDAFFPV